MKTLPRLLFVSALSVCAATAVAANGPAPAQAAPGQRHVGTADELRACLNQKDQLDERQKALGPKQAEAKASMDKVQADQTTLTAQQAKLNKKDANAVKAFNAKAAELDTAIDEANAQADEVNASGSTLHNEQVKYSQTCATYVYKDWDKQAVLKERQAQGK